MWELVKDTTAEQNTFITLINDDKREPNDSNTFITLPTFRTENAKHDACTPVTNVTNVRNVNDSNTSRLSPVINVRSVNMSESNSELPQYPNRKDFQNYSTERLEYLISNKSGLWNLYASEEINKRKNSEQAKGSQK